MADDGQNFGILQDLQVHLRTAKIPLDNLSTLAQEGDEQVNILCDMCPLTLGLIKYFKILMASLVTKYFLTKLHWFYRMKRSTMIMMLIGYG